MLKDSIKLVRPEFSLVMFCLNALDRQGIHRLVGLEELKATGARKLLLDSKSDFDDTAIIIEHIGDDEDRQPMYRFVYKIFSPTTTFTWYSAEFTIEEDEDDQREADSLLNNVKLCNPKYSLTMFILDLLENKGIQELKGLEYLTKPGDRFTELITKSELGEIEILLEYKQVDEGEPVYRFVEKIRSGLTYTYVSAAFKVEKS